MKKISKIVSLFLCMAIILMTASFNVCAAFTAPVAASGGFSYVENFDGTTISNRIVLPATGTTHEDGVLKISSGKTVAFDMSDASSGTTWTGIKFFSMKLKKLEPDKAITIQNKNAQFKFYWHERGTLKYQVKGESGATLFDHPTKISADGDTWITANVLFYALNNEYKYSLWIEDGENVISVDSASTPTYLVASQSFSIQASQCDLWVDDLNVYDVDPSTIPGSTAVIWDNPLITLPERIEYSIELPTVGAYGSNISWVSSNTDVLANDGTVIPPTEDTQVTLTATFSKDGASSTKEFTVVVSKSSFVPVSGGFFYNENFDLSTISERITLPESGAVHEDGVLKISKGSAVSFDVANDKGWSGLKFFSMKLKKPNQATAISIHNENSQFKFYWHNNGLLKYQNGTSGGTLVDHDAHITAGVNDWITVNCVFNTENGNKYTLLIEDSNDGVRVNSAQSAGYLVTSKTFKISAESGDVWVDDLKVYDVVKTSVPAATAIIWDEAEIKNERFLTGVDKTDVSGKLILPATGMYGSTITWTSSDESAIANDGTVKKSITDKNVKLTATISNGSETSKTYEIDFTVKKGATTIGEAVYSGTGFVDGHLKAGDVCVSVPVNNTISDIKTLSVISAAYTSNDTLRDVDIQTVDFTSGESQNATLNLVIEDGCYIKTFVFNSMELLVPILNTPLEKRNN